jgi:hypothetical protein
MSSIVIAGDTSGSVTLQAPATAGTTVLTLPSTTGTIVTASGTATAGGVAYGNGTTAAYSAAGTAGQLLQSNGASAPTWATVSSGFTLGTPVATTSGTSVTFTGIPAGVKQIVITFKEVSTNGTSEWRIRIGDSGGIETSGYLSRSVAIVGVTVTANETNGGYIIFSTSATNKLSGSITLTLENATTFSWVGAGIVGDYDTNGTFFTSGVKSLSAELTQVSITTQNGTDAFDNGEINIAYI